MARPWERHSGCRGQTTNRQATATQSLSRNIVLFHQHKSVTFETIFIHFLLNILQETEFSQLLTLNSLNVGLNRAILDRLECPTVPKTLLYVRPDLGNPRYPFPLRLFSFPPHAATRDAIIELVIFFSTNALLTKLFLKKYGISTDERSNK